MADKRIKGITIEIGSDTVGLNKALSDVNKQSTKLQNELKDVERLLKFNPGNVEALVQKQRLLTDQVTATTEKLNRLKDAEKQVQAQFKSGKISEEQYRAFSREIEFTQGSLSKLKNELSYLEMEQKKNKESTKQLESLFKSTNTTLDDYASTLGNKLTNAIKSGTASSKQLEDAIQKIGKQALGTNVDIDKMKKALLSVDDGASLKSVKKELTSLSKEAAKAEESVNDLGGAVEGVAGALAAGGGLAGAIETALDTSSLKTKIDISFEVPEESKASITESIKNIEAYGIDGEAALEGVRRQWALNKDASDEANQSVVTMAATITNAFSGVDFTELVQEANEIGATLGITNEEALGLVNTLLKAGFPPEQLDIIAEYGDQMIQAGFTAKEVQAIMAAGVDTKTWNIDNLLDGIKEGRIQMADFGSGINKEMKGLLSQTDISAKQFVGWGQAIAKGGEGGQKAMLAATKALAGVEDATVRNQLGTKMFGTMWEDQGTKIVDTIIKAEKKQVDLKKGIDDVSASTEKLDKDPTVQMRQAFSDLKVALEPALTVIADLISKVAEWISNNPTLAATITTVVTAIGVLVGILIALSPIFTAIASIATVTGASIGAIAAPIAIAVAAIAGLIAAGILIYKNWDEISTYAQQIWGSIKDFLSSTWEGIKSAAVSVWNNIKSFFSKYWQEILMVFTGPIGILVGLIIKNWSTIKQTTSNVWNNIKSFLNGLWNGIKSTASSVFNGVKSAISNTWNNIKTATSNVWNGIKSVITTVWNGIKSYTSSAVTGIKNTISNVFTTFKSIVTSAMNNVKSAIESGWNKAKAFLQGISLKQIGTNIIDGLINGIKRAGSRISSAVKEIANGIPSTIKKILGIHSPSRVMRDEVGYWISEGIAKGIEANTKAEKAAKAKAQKIIKSFNADLKDLKMDFSAGKINTSQYMNALKKLKNEYRLYSTGVKTIDVELSKSTKKLNDEKKDILKERFDDDKAYYSNKSKLDSTSLQQELDLLNKLAKGYKKKSDERIYFENLAKQKKQEITNAKKKIDEDYLAKVKELNQKYIEEEKRLTEQYQKSVDDRAKSLYSFAGLFEEVSSSAGISGEKLLTNLQGQVTTFEEWQKNIAILVARGVDKGLISELQEMGPKSAAEIAALNTLSDEQLAKYVTLWQQKSKLARTQAISELEGMRLDTANQIIALQNETAKQLEAYKTEWKNSMKKVTSDTKGQFKNMPSIGSYAVQGLIDGMNSRKAELERVAAELAAIVAGTVQSDLDIHSPSRVFKGFGINVNEGFIQGLQQSALRLKNAMQSVYGSLATSTDKVKQQNSVTNTISTVKTETIKETVTKQPVALQLTLDGRVIAEQIYPDINNLLGTSSINAMRVQGVRKG